MQLLHEMEEDGSTPELDSYKAGIEALKDGGQWEKVSRFVFFGALVP